MHRASAAHAPSAKSVTYPASADSIDLPHVSFRKKENQDAFILSSTADHPWLLGKNEATSNRARALDDLRLKRLLAPIWPDWADVDITVIVTARRGPLLRLKVGETRVIVQAHWNLFIPYFYQIKDIPLVHAEVLDAFTSAVFHYAILATKHPQATKHELDDIVINAYLVEPQFLLASLDIFNKPNIYHIHPASAWVNRIFAANDEHRVEIDASPASAASLVSPAFLEEVTCFVHHLVKGYAFRYVDYLWTQRYKIVCGIRPDINVVAYKADEVVINIYPLINKAPWKPVLYLNLGYAVMLAILESSGGKDSKSICLSMMKTWNRYLGFEAVEQQGVREVCGLLGVREEDLGRSLLRDVTGKEGLEIVDDAIALTDYSRNQTFPEREGSPYTKLYYERLWDSVQNLNTTLMRNNTSHAKLIEVLRNDNVDHVQLADLLLTGRLDKRSVVEVGEWLLLRTLVYDLINAPKVFKNDYKMLLKVLTKVNKGLIVYIWTLILSNDVRCELFNAYVSRLITDIFVFDRVKIYEIVADPAECLEAEAVTGYLLNWAGLSLEKWRSIIGGALSRLPRNVVRHLSVQTTREMDQLIRAMTIRASGLIGFYLYRAYRWGSTGDELTERIRSHFPELLKQAQKATLPQNTLRGGAMLLLVLAQIISDERDGFAKNVAVTEEDRAMVHSLIQQCVNWDQKHFVIMVGGIAAGYAGSIDEWILQQFDTLLGRYGGGDRVVLRSVVQFDVEILVERTLVTAKVGEESELWDKIQLLLFNVDPVISNQANKSLRAVASRYGIQSPEVGLKRKDIRELVTDLCRRIRGTALKDPPFCTF